MKLFFRKAWRDLRRKKTRSIPIIIVIIIGGMASIMYSNLYFSLVEILDVSWEDHQYHHLLVTTKPTSISNLTSAASQAISQTQFDLNFEVRAFYEVQVEISGIWETDTEIGLAIKLIINIDF